MKSIVFLVAIILAAISVNAQSLGDVCQDKQLVGVEIKPQGFRNSVEAEKLAAAVMNLDLRDPSAGYCLTAAAGRSERRLVVIARMRVLGKERSQDELKPQLIRSGIRIGVGEILRRVPSGMRSTIRQTSRQYTQEPRITVAQVEVTTETWMYGPGGIVLWRGLASRVFNLQETRLYGYQPKKVEILSGGNTGELLPYGQAVVLPGGTNVEYRAEQLMKLLVTMDSMQRENIIVGGQELLAKNQPQEVR